MSKIRKGSIVWDKLSKEKTKVLTSPTKGELPDNVFEKTGLKYHFSMRGYVLVRKNDPENSYSIRYNNAPCRTRSVTLHLILYSEYLKSLN